MSLIDLSVGPGGVTIDWDGEEETYNSVDNYHSSRNYGWEWQDTKTRTVKITGDVLRYGKGAHTSSIDGMEYQQYITSMTVSGMSQMVECGGMFRKLSNVNHIDITKFDTSNVTNMDCMFSEVGYENDNINSVGGNSADIDLSHLDTKKVESMEGMFWKSGLTSIDLSSFRTPALKTINKIFLENHEPILQSVNVDNWDTSKVEWMEDAFRATGNLEHLTDLSHVTFSLDLKHWDTTSLKSTRNMFRHCMFIKTLDISNWNVTNMAGSDTTNLPRRDMYGMFFYARSIENCDLSNWCVSHISSVLPSWSELAPFANDPSNLPAWGENCSEVPTPTPSPSVTLDSGSQGPIGDGHTFSTKADLQTAVDAWDANSTSAEAEYGNINNWNVSAIEDMSYLFSSKSNITTLDLSGWDTSNVTNMNRMFNTHNLTSLTFGDNFNTSNVTNMNGMFHCPVQSLDVSNFVTSSVEDMSNMFSHCSSLTSLDVSNFDTSSVEAMNVMFWNCSSLTSLDVSNFDISSVTRRLFLQSMFHDCTSLTSVVGLSSWCVSHISPQPNWFADNAPFANDPSNLPAWGENCSEVPTPTPSPSVTLDSGSQGPIGDGHTFSTKADLQTAVDEWASDSTSATETYGDISTWDVSAITDMSDLFNGWNKSNWNFTSLDLSNWDMSNKTDISQMFSNCPNLTSLNVVGWNVENVEQCYGLFYNCSGLETLDITGWSLPSVTNMNGMFSTCESLNTLIGYENLVQNSVNIISGLFSNCKKLTSLDLSNWDVSEVTNMAETFYNCQSLNTADLSSWCVENLSEPDRFAKIDGNMLAPFANTASNLPKWGQPCP